MLPLRRRPLRYWPVFAVACVVGAAASSATAAPAPVGPEYAINNRSLPPRQWWTSCTDASGKRATLIHHCEGNDCDEHPGDLYLQRYNQGGDAAGPAVQVNENPAWLVGFRVACSDNGWVAAQWREHGCYKHRAFGPDNEAGGPITSADSTDCRVRPNVAIGDDGKMVAAWPDWLPGEGSQILVQRFGADGVAPGDGVMVSEGTAGSRVQPKVSIDTTGAALVVWLGEVDGSSGHGPVSGRFVGVNGQPKGAGFKINTFAFGENSDPAIARLGAGVFEVAWNNPLEGGRVAREVHANAAASLAAPAVAAAGVAPHFGAPRVVDSERGLGFAGSVHAGTGPTWLYTDAYNRHWRTDDDSKTWSAPFVLAGDSHDHAHAGTNGAGVWVALRTSNSDEIGLSRSTDDAATWSDLASHIDNPKPASIERARVRGAGSTFVAAWSTPNGDSSSLVFSRSGDGGLTWSNPKVVATGEDSGRLGFELATDGGGTWIVMLADEGIRFVRSTDDGRNWSAPAAVLSDVYCPSCATSWRYTRVSLASDGNDGWLAMFAAPLYQTGTFGRDGDVYVLRSSDGGDEWSAPVSMASHAAADGSPDFSPSIATDGSGRWLATWVSHHPIGAGTGAAIDGLDSDVLEAVSDDFGATWSEPELLDSSMAGDEAGDAHVSLASGSDGRWLVAWQRSKFSPAPWLVGDDLMVAAAEATCGNGDIEIGEACDDAQTVDDDGCDSNCTTSGCGNGIVNAGEACDDGNKTSEDGCTTACEEARCGDGIVSPGESCDDGNDDDNDSCPSDCGAPYCGDGLVHHGVEECDDGGYSTAACTPECTKARCGDGFVALRAEACDDGNAIDDDACPNDCSNAVCGDGYSSLGWEECDPLDPFFASACTDDCRLVGLCGDANADTFITVGDAQRILRRAVGLNVSCPRAACDMDANGSISVSDSHMDLRKSVGLEVGDVCSIGTGTIVFWIEDTREIGAFQIAVDYSSTGGEFAGSGSGVACVPILDAETRFLAAFNDVDAISTLTAGIIALNGFEGRVDLFACEFEMPDEMPDAHFAISVEDATDPDGYALDPKPLVGYRVE